MRDCVNLIYDAELFARCANCGGIVGSYYGGLVDLYHVTYVRVRNTYMGTRSLCENLNCVNTDCVRYVARRGVSDYNERYRHDPLHLSFHMVITQHTFLSSMPPSSGGLRCVDFPHQFMSRYSLLVEHFDCREGRWIPQASRMRATVSSVVAVTTTGKSLCDIFCIDNIFRIDFSFTFSFLIYIFFFCILAVSEPVASAAAADNFYDLDVVPPYDVPRSVLATDSVPSGTVNCFGAVDNAEYLQMVPYLGVSSVENSHDYSPTDPVNLMSGVTLPESFGGSPSDDPVAGPSGLAANDRVATPLRKWIFFFVYLNYIVYLCVVFFFLFFLFSVSLVDASTSGSDYSDPSTVIDLTDDRAFCKGKRRDLKMFLIFCGKN